MRIIITLLLSCYSVFALSQSAVKPKYSPRGEKHKNQTDVLDRKQGLWKHYNYMKTFVWEVEYLNDMKHGISRRYYSYGKVMKETEYKYGIRDGIFRRYNYDGVVSEGEYVDGKKSNEWTNYFSNGQIKSTGSYFAGHKKGIWKYYNRKGQLVNTIEFRNGRNVQDIIAEEKKAREAAAKNSRSKVKKQ